MKNYPSFDTSKLADSEAMLRYIAKERRNDVRDWDNLKNIFMSGRKTGKIPTGAGDVTDADSVGDFNIDYGTGYAYFLVDDGAGNAVWTRIALETSW